MVQTKLVHSTTCYILDNSSVILKIQGLVKHCSQVGARRLTCMGCRSSWRSCRSRRTRTRPWWPGSPRPRPPSCPWSPRSSCRMGKLLHSTENVLLLPPCHFTIHPLSHLTVEIICRGCAVCRLVAVRSVGEAVGAGGNRYYRY